MRIERFNCVSLPILVFASIVALAILLSSPSLVHAVSRQRAPIVINGDSGFTSPNPVNGGGSGTVGDPYIIENWAINASSADGILIQNTTKYFVIRNCLVENGGGSHSGIHLSNVINGRIENNRCLYNNLGIYLYSSSYNILSYNTCSSSLDTGISIYSSNYNTVDNNTCENNADIAIYIYSSSYERIANNSNSNNSVHSIYLRFSSYDNLINNNCHNNHQEGIYLADSSNNILRQNNCSNNASNKEGISLEDSNGNTVDNNICSNGMETGIVIKASSNNSITNNTCDNDQTGIKLWSASISNIIFNNTVENNNDTGINILSSSAGNTIYLNSIVTNTTQANDSEGFNGWDNSSAGNYWSDYVGSDVNGDGIGDTPYYISGGNNQDRYPLMELWSPVKLNLVWGWNLVGFTGVGATDTPTNLFVPLNYYTDFYLLWFTAPGGPYEFQGPEDVFNDNMGYWAWINQDEWVGTSGTRPVSENIHIKKGWNLVSFPIVDNTTTPNKIFAPLVYNTNYLMYYWNAPGGPYVQPDPTKALNDNTGYWVWIDQDWTVTVP